VIKNTYRPTMTSSKHSWITLKEARERSDWKVEWWKFEGLDGEMVQEKQHLPGHLVDQNREDLG